MSDSFLEVAALRLLYSFSFLVLCPMTLELFMGLLPLREAPFFRQVLVSGDLSCQLTLMSSRVSYVLLALTLPVCGGLGQL